MPGFGAAMVPLGSAMGVGVSQFNAFQQQALRNQLAQQDMQLKQQEMDLQRRQMAMQEGQTKFNMGHEIYNQKQQEAAQHAASSMFSSAGSLAKTPEERQFWDFAANAAFNHLPPEYIFNMAKEMGYDQQSKQMLDMYKAMYYGSGAALNTAAANAIGGTGVPAGTTIGGGAMPGGSLGTTPLPPFPALGYGGSGYAGAPGVSASSGLPAISGAPPTPMGGRGYGGAVVPSSVPTSPPGYPSVGTSPPLGGGGAVSGGGGGAYLSPDGTKLWKDGKIYNLTPAGG